MSTRANLHPLFRALGGRTTLTAVVDHFYAHVLADPVLAPFFAGTDMDQQRAHQLEFLSAALGGPDAYQGKSLRTAHAGRGIKPEHFQRVAGHLQASLQWAQVDARALQAVMATVATLLPEIVE